MGYMQSNADSDSLVDITAPLRFMLSANGRFHLTIQMDLLCVHDGTPSSLLFF